MDQFTVELAKEADRIPKKRLASTSTAAHFFCIKSRVEKSVLKVGRDLLEWKKL
jgi:hypothetical protein